MNIAQEAYIKAEYAAEKLAGSEKMDVALNYALEKLRGLVIIRTRDEVRNKIQEAWVKLDKVPNQQTMDTDKLTKALKVEIEKAVQ